MEDVECEKLKQRDGSGVDSCVEVLEYGRMLGKIRKEQTQVYIIRYVQKALFDREKLVDNEK